jgi:putative Mg2+ transporter-C (MgtC) family protein
MLIERFPWLMEPSLISITVRTLLAIVCAGIIGYERGSHGSTAGFRTHILVCLGATLAMATGQFAAEIYGADVTRIGAQVVSGIGFLGAGSIIVTRQNHISGLTTAAGLWASACIGLAIGIGFYEAAVVGTAAVFFTEKVLKRVSRKLTANAFGNGSTEDSESEDDYDLNE